MKTIKNFATSELGSYALIATGCLVVVGLWTQSERSALLITPVAVLICALSAWQSSKIK